jgi:hypothetical protein
MKKLIVFLLLLNFIATMSVGYIIYDNTLKQHQITIELPNEPEEIKFKEDVYQGLGRLMYGQNVLNLRLLSLHHFVKPHGDEIYDNCPECQLEHPEIVEDEKNNITSNKGAKEWNL